MALNLALRRALLLAVMAVLVELSAASHFRGAIVQWRPVDPVNFDGRVEVTHRIAWRRGTAFCDASTVAAGNLIGQGGAYACRSGCSGSLGSTQFQCTDFSVSEDWSAGQGSSTVTLSGVTNFEASYTGAAWISLVLGGGSWEVRVKGNLSPRADNGRINSSPTTAVSPVFRLRHGAAHTITIPVSDADGDIVRCRWATSSQGECGGVCQTFPATLDQNNCRLTYNANGALGWYAAALQVEDFISSSSTTPMSSVPVQFLVLVLQITVPPGITDPTFVGSTPEDGACVTVGSTFTQQITARSGGDAATIADISTVSPPGMTRSALTAVNSRESSITVTWTPSAAQQGANIFCYSATDNFGLTSPQTCITLVVGVARPQLMSVNMENFGGRSFRLSLDYDQGIAKPSASRLVNVFRDDGVRVLSVDVSSSSPDVVYSGTTLSITTTTPFLSFRMYYILADAGVAVATAFCPLETAAVVNTGDWVFGVPVTTCQMNEYVAPGGVPGLEVCDPCPARSTSPGDRVIMCTCDPGTGRVDEADVSQPCLPCPGPPESPAIASHVPPNVDLSWSRPSATGAWRYMYDVAWRNGNNIVPRQAATTGQITGLQADEQYTVMIAAFPDSTLCPAQSAMFTFRTSQRCPSPAPTFSGSPTVQPGVVRVNWTAAGSSDPLVTGIRYALYSQCGVEITFQLIDDDIQGLSYDITTLPSLTDCVLRVVVYGDLCLLNVDGPNTDTTDTFTTVCPVNEYVGGTPEACQPCPAMSSSPGGVVRVCPCMDGTGRVDESDPSLPCVVCPGPAEGFSVASPVPPNVDLLWDAPDTPDMWSFMYLVEWLDETSAAGDMTSRQTTLSGLEAETEYEVTVTAFTDSTLCPEQSVNFTFNTTQRCPDTGPLVVATPVILPGSATVTWQAAQTDDPLLATGMRYAVYRQCGTESSYQLVDENIDGLSYTLTSLPAPSQCVLRVVAYHRYCLRDLDGILRHETLLFTTAIVAPEQPSPPSVTVGGGGFTIGSLGLQAVVVEYVCNYTAVITGYTSQIRLDPSESVDIAIQQPGGYIVQCAGVNADGFQGGFGESTYVTVEGPAPVCDRSDIVAVALLVTGGILIILLFLIVVGIIFAWNHKKGKGDIKMDAM